MKETFDFLLKSISPTRVIAFALTGVCIYLWIKGMALDETLRTSWLIVLGFWFKTEIDTIRSRT